MTAARLILASASPRRADLLSAAGLRFEVRSADVDESFEPTADPERIAAELALRKLHAIRAELGIPSETCFLLGGDTLVVHTPAAGSGELPTYLGKPADATEAEVMLRSLSATTHRVVTGIAVLRVPAGSEASEVPGELATGAETTWVTMRAIEPGEIDAYVASGEWRDKAGGYAIQETADRFVTGLAGGGFDNVVGLPVELALELLAAVGWPRGD